MKNIIFHKGLIKNEKGLNHNMLQENVLLIYSVHEMKLLRQKREVKMRQHSL